jgi:hypothetical protein
MHYQQGGEICIQFKTRGRNAFCKEESLHQWGEKEGYSVQGENLSLHAFVQGELAFMLWELYASPEFALCFALLPMVSSPFASPCGVGSLEHFVSVVLSRCLALEDRDLLFQVILLLLFGF